MISFETIKRYYDEGLWDKSRVANAVEKRVITREQYVLITHKPYGE